VAPEDAVLWRAAYNPSAFIKATAHHADELIVFCAWGRENVEDRTDPGHEPTIKCAGGSPGLSHSMCPVHLAAMRAQLAAEGAR
jgi:hypothetical protein